MYGFIIFACCCNTVDIDTATASFDRIGVGAAAGCVNSGIAFTSHWKTVDKDVGGGLDDRAGTDMWTSITAVRILLDEGNIRKSCNWSHKISFMGT